MYDLNITLIQASLVWESPKTNLLNFSEKIHQIKEIPDLIVLPEMFNTGFTMNVDKCAESMSGETMKWLKTTAKDLSCVVTGSLLIKENNKYFNRIIWMRPDGSFDSYNKRHLFRMVDEHKTMSQGNERKIVELNGWKINLQICYDLRFPVWSKNNFENNQHEYDILLYVSNWPEVRSHAYKSLLLARAIENQAYVIWVNRVGKDGNNVNHSGDTMVIDPQGKIVNQTSAGKEMLLNTLLSANHLQKLRSKFKVGLDWDKFSIDD